MENKRLSIIDFVILYMGTHLRAKRGEVLFHLEQEYGPRVQKRSYLFNRIMGHVSSDFNPEHRNLEKSPWMELRKTYWFRTKPGIYGLNHAGWLRYTELRSAGF